MDQMTEKQEFWAFIRRGWFTSTFLAVLLLLLSFKDIIYGLLRVPDVLNELSSASPFWQSVVKDGVTHNIGILLESVRPMVALIGGGALFLYSVVSGYRRTHKALNINSTYVNVTRRNPGDITLRSIAIRSLFVNLPILYWAAFLFLLLPQLVQLPLASLSTGSTAAMAEACVLMVVSTAFVAHIGILIVRLFFRFITSAY
jgi:hypothetical protein